MLNTAGNGVVERIAGPRGCRLAGKLHGKSMVGVLIGLLIKQKHKIICQQMFQQQMESVSMIRMAQVAEFVQKHIVLKHLRQTDNIQVQIDIAFCGTAAPVGSIMLDSYLVICKSLTCRKFCQTHR